MNGDDVDICLCFRVRGMDLLQMDALGSLSHVFEVRVRDAAGICLEGSRTDETSRRRCQAGEGKLHMT